MQALSTYDYFYDFAWERLEDVLGLDRATGIPNFSPFIEFVEGCAFMSLWDMTEKEQEESFGFTLREMIADGNDFSYRLLKNERDKSIY
jgi:hypothetical protein